MNAVAISGQYLIYGHTWMSHRRCAYCDRAGDNDDDAHTRTRNMCLLSLTHFKLQSLNALNLKTVIYVHIFLLLNCDYRCKHPHTHMQNKPNISFTWNAEHSIRLFAFFYFYRSTNVWSTSFVFLLKNGEKRKVKSDVEQQSNNNNNNRKQIEKPNDDTFHVRHTQSRTRHETNEKKE